MAGRFEGGSGDLIEEPACAAAFDPRTAAKTPSAQIVRLNLVCIPIVSSRARARVGMSNERASVDDRVPSTFRRFGVRRDVRLYMPPVFRR
jgi:hypothetical protein